MDKAKTLQNRSDLRYCHCGKDLTSYQFGSKIIQQKLTEASTDAHVFTLEAESLVPAKGEDPLPNQFIWVFAAPAKKECRQY